MININELIEKHFAQHWHASLLHPFDAGVVIQAA